MTVARGLRGGWVAVEAVSAANAEEVERLDEIRQRTPNLGGAGASMDARKNFGAPMVIREIASGRAIGLIENGVMSGYPDVAVVLFFTDPDVARPGIATEAFAMYVAHVFEKGARLVHLEVLAFDRPVLHMIRRLGLEEQARLRDQAYAAGRFWGVAVFSFDSKRFEEIWNRYGKMLPGGGHGPSALGSSRI